MLRTLFLLLALAGALAAPLAQGNEKNPYDKAIETYGCGDYPKAYKEFMVLAQQGMPIAWYQIGLMTEQGQGTASSMSTALEWYTKAAEKGIADAYYALGQIYSKGEVVAKDPAQAYALFDLAVKGGSKVAKDWRKMEAERLGPGDLVKAQEYAQQWLAKAQR